MLFLSIPCQVAKGLPTLLSAMHKLLQMDRMLRVFFLLSGAFLALTLVGLVPVWLLVLVLLRDLVISIGAYAYRRIMGRLSVKPTRISKLNTLVQFLFVVLLLANRPFLHWPVWWTAFATGAVTASTVLSGIDYVWAYGWPALGHLRERAKA